jgi:hypothetical protein
MAIVDAHVQGFDGLIDFFVQTVTIYSPQRSQRHMRPYIPMAREVARGFTAIEVTSSA